MTEHYSLLQSLCYLSFIKYSGPSLTATGTFAVHTHQQQQQQQQQQQVLFEKKSNLFDILSESDEFVRIKKENAKDEQDETQDMNVESDEEMKLDYLDQQDFYQVADDQERELIISMKKLVIDDLNHVPNPMYHMNRSLCEQKITREQIIDMLRKELIRLPVSLASHENRLLQEGGSWQWNVPSNSITFQMPACQYGSKCVVITMDIPGLSSSEYPAIGPLMIYMTSEEWDQLPRVPTDPRPCLLCYRYYTSRFVINVKAHTRLQTSKTFCFQLYRNLINENNGYKMEHTLIPSAKTWLGFVNPIVRFQRLCLKAVYNVSCRRWCINQDDILYVPSTTRSISKDQDRPGFVMEHSDAGSGSGSGSHLQKPTTTTTTTTTTSTTSSTTTTSHDNLVFLLRSDHYFHGNEDMNRREEKGKAIAKEASILKEDTIVYDPRPWLLRELFSQKCLDKHEFKWLQCTNASYLIQNEKEFDMIYSQCPSTFDHVMDSVIHSFIDEYKRTGCLKLKYFRYCCFVFCQAEQKYQMNHASLKVDNHPKKEHKEPNKQNKKRTKTTTTTSEQTVFKRKHNSLEHALGVMSTWFAHVSSALKHGGIRLWNKIQHDDTFWPMHPKTLNYVTTETNIVRYNNNLVECPFWQTVNLRKNDIQHAFYKFAPLKSQVREVSEIFISKMDHNPEFAFAFGEWIFCSILGNYSHCNVRLSLSRKHEWYTLWYHGTQTMRYLVQIFLRRHQLLCLFIGREYFMFLCNEEPAMQSVLHATFDWNVFSKIVIQTMDRLRQFINVFGFSALLCPSPRLDTLALDHVLLQQQQQEMQRFLSHVSLSSKDICKILDLDKQVCKKLGFISSDGDIDMTCPAYFTGISLHECSQHTDSISEIIQFVQNIGYISTFLPSWKLIPSDYHRLQYVFVVISLAQKKAGRDLYWGSRSTTVKKPSVPLVSAMATKPNKRGRPRHTSVQSLDNPDPFQIVSKLADIQDPSQFACSIHDWCMQLYKKWKAIDKQHKISSDSSFAFVPASSSASSLSVSTSASMASNVATVVATERVTERVTEMATESATESLTTKNHKKRRKKSQSKIKPNKRMKSKQKNSSSGKSKKKCTTSKKTMMRTDLLFLTEAQAEMEKIFYLREKPCFLQTILNHRGGFKSNEMTLDAKMNKDTCKLKQNRNDNKDTEVNEMEEMDEMEEMEEIKEMKEMEDDMEEENTDQETMNSNQKDSTFVDFGLKAKHYHIMAEWMARQDDKSDECMIRIMKKLPAFLMDSSALNCIQELYQSYNQRKTLIETQIHQNMIYLKTNLPYAYSVFYAFAFMWSRHVEVDVYELPEYYRQFQMNAIRQRNHLSLDDPFPDKEVCFWFCPVCDFIYTLHVTGEETKDDRLLIPYGYQKPIVDHEQDDFVLYCNKINKTQHLHLPMVRLKCVFLLGMLFRLDENMYYICPECGRHALWKPDYHTYTLKGLLCYLCNKVRAAPCEPLLLLQVR